MTADNTTTNKKLTEKQELFLDALFSSESGGDANIAKRIAGYHESISSYQIMRSVKDEIIKRTEEAVAMKAAKAVHKYDILLDDPAYPGGPTLLATVNSILDKAGIVKKDKLEMELKTPNGILVLPAKEIITKNKAGDIQDTQTQDE